MHRGGDSLLRAIVAGLRSGDWITRERVRFYSKLAIVLSLTLAAMTWLSLPSRPPVVRDHIVFGDFIAFWTAGSLALEGQAAAAYDFDVLRAEQARLTETTPKWPWLYPPIYLLPMAVLATLPYAWALVSWLAATGLAYLACMYRLVPDRTALLAAVAFPAVALNGAFQQNGFLSAALLGAGILALEAHPLRAGILFGLLCLKPQLAVLVPFALVAARQWRALLSMSLTVLVLVAATLLLFGTDPWWALEQSAPMTARVLEHEKGPPWMMVTPFSAVRLLGGTPGIAWLIQLPISAAATLAVIWAWRRPGPIGAKGALLAALALVATPYGYFYDLVVLGVAVACLAREGIRHGFLPWEKAVLAVAWLLPAAWLMPAVMRVVAYAPDIPLVPFVAASLAVCALRRQFQAARTVVTPKAPASAGFVR